MNTLKLLKFRTFRALKYSPEIIFLDVLFTEMPPPNGKRLVYTRDSGRLTFEQRSFYETNGYLVIRRLVPLDLLEKCSKRFDDIAAGVADKGMMTGLYHRYFQ